MKILCNGNISSNKRDILSGNYELSKYVVVNKFDDNYVLYNLKNGSIISLSENDIKEISNISEDNIKDSTLCNFLISNRFLVSNKDSENEAYDIDYVEQLKGKFDKCNSYTIFTTFNCNANCYYCYELGVDRKIGMSDKTIDNTIKFIKANYDNSKPLKFHWFGGEPLLNKHVITKICTAFKNDNIEFNSMMTSNGYLVKESDIAEYKTLWNLNNVQITLDGTEKEYNKIKAFKPKSSAFKKVLHNIDILSKNEISVTLRININNENFDDCKQLTDDLLLKYKDNKYVRIYVSIIYDDVNNTLKDNFMQLIFKCLDINYTLSLNNKANPFTWLYNFPACGAYGSTLNIYPNGIVKRCEHIFGLSDNKIGNVNESTEYDKDFLFFENELSKPKSNECLNCKYLPSCHGVLQCESFSMQSLYHVCKFDKNLVDELTYKLMKNIYELNIENLKDNEIIC